MPPSRNGKKCSKRNMTDFDNIILTINVLKGQCSKRTKLWSKSNNATRFVHKIKYSLKKINTIYKIKYFKHE